MFENEIEVYDIHVQCMIWLFSKSSLINIFFLLTPSIILSVEYIYKYHISSYQFPKPSPGICNYSY